MKDEKRRDVAHVLWKKPARAYASALLAVGLAAGMTMSGVGRVAWGADDAQALDPVNISGTKSTVPAANVPESAPKTTQSVPETAQKAPESAANVPAPSSAEAPAAAAAAPVAPTSAPSNDGAAQAVSPVDVSKNAPTTPPAPATPTVPAAPSAPAAPAAETPAVVAPAAPVIPAAPESAPAPAAVAAPVTPAAPETAPATEPAVAATAPDVGTPSTAPGAGTASAATLPGLESSAAPIATDGPLYPCTGIVLKYHEDHPGEPPIAQLMETPIRLGVVNDGYVTTRPGVPVTAIKLKDIGQSAPQAVHQNGLNAIYLQVVDELNRRGIVGVFVVVDETDVIDQGPGLPPKDVRDAGQTKLHLTIVTSTVKRVRTLATGNDVKGDRVDNPRYQWIKDRSPLQGGERGDLLNKDVLDDYVLRLNRMPGRHVDVAVSGTGITKEDTGKVNLDYLVAESRPWYVYAQVSNTGTAQTNDWRERFGFVDNQLTGHDDILTLDFITAGFDDASQDAILGYEFPVPFADRLRNKIYGSWNEFTASDVGQAKEQFSGQEWIVGDELTMNLYQQRELFIDGIGGVRAQGITTHNQSLNTPDGDVTYYSPYGTLRIERGTELAATNASLTAVGYLANATEKEVEALDRAPVSVDSFVMEGDVTQTFYLEPLLDPKGFVNGAGTLANEVYLHAHGQYAFGSRLFPQAEDVAGGFYTVRGYPESIMAGDSVYVLNTEYRLHIPRLFPIQPDPTKTPFLWDKSFRASPQQAYGRPDWDLISRVFLDVGRVMYSDRQQFERNGTLVGTGVGLELQYKQNFNIRVDWGIALNSLKNPDPTQQVSEGSNRFHISATILY